MPKLEYKVLDKYYHSSEQFQDELNFQMGIGGWNFIGMFQPDGPKYETTWTVLVRPRLTGEQALN